MPRRERRGRHEPMVITIRAPGSKVELTKSDVATILQALTDAESWRRRGVDQWCRRCENAAQGRCGEHAADLERASAYGVLAADLAGVLPEPPGGGGAS